jgi:hypothetical protein
MSSGLSAFHFSSFICESKYNHTSTSTVTNSNTAKSSFTGNERRRDNLLTTIEAGFIMNAQGYIIRRSVDKYRRGQMSAWHGQLAKRGQGRPKRGQLIVQFFLL